MALQNIRWTLTKDQGCLRFFKSCSKFMKMETFQLYWLEYFPKVKFKFCSKCLLSPLKVFASTPPQVSLISTPNIFLSVFSESTVFPLRVLSCLSILSSLSSFSSLPHLSSLPCLSSLPSLSNLNYEHTIFLI